MELFHKANLDDFKTLDPTKYTFSLNGRKGITLEEIGKLEVCGMSIFTVDEHNKIVKVEFFYDPGQLLGSLLKGEKLGTSSQETASICPVLRSTG
ncbi:pathogen-related protein [Prunus persica]|uniref:pathogen-related protein n=1 Tax=Prunus persica TaxID=3760 RepID=UPI0009AB2A05|nr:pathogen-related protein [Prunus persica]